MYNMVIKWRKRTDHIAPDDRASKGRDRGNLTPLHHSHVIAARRGRGKDPKVHLAGHSPPESGDIDGGTDVVTHRKIANKHSWSWCRRSATCWYRTGGIRAPSWRHRHSRVHPSQWRSWQGSFDPPIGGHQSYQKILGEVNPDVPLGNACGTTDVQDLAAMMLRTADAIVKISTASRAQIIVMENPVGFTGADGWNNGRQPELRLGGCEPATASFQQYR